MMILPKLTNERLALAYDFLATCAPFDDWNLPSSDEMEFGRTRDRTCRGWHDITVRRGVLVKRIRINPHKVTTIDTLYQVMGHEMIHVHENATGMMTRAQHSETFMILADQVCRLYGWDVETFALGESA